MKRELAWQQNQLCYVNLMASIRKIHPGMGLREMYFISQPDGIGRDAFIELGMANGYRLIYPKNHTRTTYSNPSAKWSNLLSKKSFTDVNQIWTADITYYAIGEEFYYIALILDVYSRRIIGYCVANHMRAEMTLEALQMALDLRGIEGFNKSLIHHTDRGTQYTSNLYTDLLKKYSIQISMCRSVYENTHVERLNKTVKNQYLRMFNPSPRNFKELKVQLAKTIKAYNEGKPHRSLKRLTPIEFENQLDTINLNQRPKLVIYTDEKSKIYDQQLSLF